MAHTLPPLPYAYDALAPVIDEETMKLHHDAHHAAYVNKLNAAIQGHPELEKLEVDTLLQGIESVPSTIRTTVRNNGGGHLNHSIFWRLMTPNKGGAPIADVTKELNKQFGSFEKFQALFQTTGEGHFGSGWVWLVRGPEGPLQVISTPNQDSPVMQGLYPVLGNDLWEHAYYLTYRNKRGEYLKNWWQVVNWEEVAHRLDESMSWFDRKAA